MEFWVGLGVYILTHSSHLTLKALGNHRPGYVSANGLILSWKPGSPPILAGVLRQEVICDSPDLS